MADERMGTAIEQAIFRSIEDQVRGQISPLLSFMVSFGDATRPDLGWELWEGEKSNTFHPYMRAGFFFLVAMPATTFTYELANPAFPDNLITDMIELERYDHEFYS